MAVTFTLRLPDNLDDLLEAYCARTGATRSGAVRVALEQFLNVRAGLEEFVKQTEGVGRTDGARRGPDTAAAAPEDVSGLASRPPRSQVTPDFKDKHKGR